MRILSPLQRSVGSVRRLGLFDLGALQRLLASEDERNALLLGWVHHNGVVPEQPGQSFVFHGVADEDELHACALLIGGVHLVFGPGSVAHHRRLFAELLRRGQLPASLSGPLMVVQEAEQALRRVARLRTFQLQPQRCLRLASRDLRYSAQDHLRRALPDDIDALWYATVAMHAEERSVSPTPEEQAALRDLVSAQIQDRRLWCLTDPIDGRLLFKAALAPSAPSGALVEGVWVAPHIRRRGLGQRAFSELCRHLLLEYEVVVLHVATKNEAALRLYAALGFEPICDTALLHSGGVLDGPLAEF